MHRNDAEQLALAHSESGLHCAESVASAIAEMFCPEHAEIACRMATGFGGGMGGCRQETCGALTGGILAIGLLCGRISPEQSRGSADQLTTIYRDRFIARFGNSVCQPLRDTFDTDDTKAACRSLTAEAAGILYNILQEHGLVTIASNVKETESIMSLYGGSMNQAALVLVDVQKGFDDPYWGDRNNPDAEKNISRILEVWRAHGYPIIHVQHRSVEPNSPLRPDRPGCEFKPEAMPHVGETVFWKNTNSAFIGTTLEKHLRDYEISSIVIAGFTTDHCVSTTTRMAGNLGFCVYLVADATATFNRADINGVDVTADEIQRIHLASLNGEFCQVLNTEELMGKFERNVDNFG